MLTLLPGFAEIKKVLFPRLVCVEGVILDRCGNYCFYILQINGALLAFGIEMTMV